jgi:hypothetical protein
MAAGGFSRRLFSTASNKVLNVLKLPPNISIFRQLEIEEALLRTDHRSWCVLNTMERDSSNAGGLVVSLLSV